MSIHLVGAEQAQQGVNEKLLAYCASASMDPLGWAKTAYPWGKAELEGKELYPWQVDLLGAMADELELQRKTGVSRPIRFQIVSGHGVGKSALIGMVTDWAMSTMAQSRAVITANTETQLKQKTWAEMAKWRRLSPTRDWFTLSATSLYSNTREYQKTWRADLVPWSEKSPEAFAGLHNMGRRIFLAFDEGSAIPSIIYETAEGFMTDQDTQIIWLVFGNPTRNVGQFAVMAKSQRARWKTKHIDARDIPGTNKEEIAEWIEVYGEDSDFVRVRVKGQFPRASSLQLISEQWVSDAQKREAVSMPEDPFVVGIDVSRGGDRTVMYPRRGRDGRTIRYKATAETRDSMVLSNWIVTTLNQWKPDTVFIDAGGVGGPIADRVRQLGWQVIDVYFGESPENKDRYKNKRAEIWGRMADWLHKKGAIPTEYELYLELVSQEITGTDADMLQLVRKDHMRAQGLPSPDIADALALTFSHTVVSAEAIARGGVSYGNNEAETQWNIDEDDTKAELARALTDYRAGN